MTPHHRCPGYSLAPIFPDAEEISLCYRRGLGFHVAGHPLIPVTVQVRADRDVDLPSIPSDPEEHWLCEVFTVVSAIHHGRMLADNIYATLVSQAVTQALFRHHDHPEVIDGAATALDAWMDVGDVADRLGQDEVRFITNLPESVLRESPDEVLELMATLSRMGRRYSSSPRSA